MSLVSNFNEVIALTVGLNQIQFKGQSVESFQNSLFKQFDKIKKITLLNYSEIEYQESLFAICAWIDEIVLCSSWKEKLSWKKKMLQKKYFDTTRAGEVFFDKLDTIAPGEIDLMEVYFYCLRLGFKGKYHRSQDSEILTEKSKLIYKQIIDQYGGDFDKPLVNCVLTPLACIETNYFETNKKRKNKQFLTRMMWWLMPLIPFAIVTIVFNEVIQAMALDYFKNFS